jgi:competence protein ComEC
MQWRLVVLAGATVGLAASPFVGTDDPEMSLPLAPIGIALVVLRPWRASSPPQSPPGASWLWLALVALTACAAGAALGGLRVRSIDAGAFDRLGDRPVTATGFVIAVPHRSDGTVSVRVETADGRLQIEAPEPVPDLAVGREVRARGTLRAPEDWEAGYLLTHGIEVVLDADRIEPTGARRGGLAGVVDRVRDRAEAALERGMPEQESVLARGFVLGQDDRIDPETVAEFKRSGLAHLLAVSGQNVVLLGLLAVPLLAALNLSLRVRLVCILVLIALYVPVTGAGPSIQRAGVMGAAAILAGLAGRPRSRWYALLLAAFVTLAMNPRSSADVGWQLSFAAVAGILLWAQTMRDLLLGARAARPSEAGPIRRGLAEGAALTIAATLATAPLMSHHFEAFSVAALPANLLALPAVAPVMWLGMLAAMIGQAPAIPVEPLNAVCGLLIGYVAWVAHALGSAGWAQARIELPLGGVVVAYAGLLTAGVVAQRCRQRRVVLGVRRQRWLVPALAALCLCVAFVVAAGWSGSSTTQAARPPALEVSVLDVGQGDAILLEPAGADPILVDAGPPGAGIAEQLADEGVERLAVMLITHDQLDHAGGVPEVLGSVPVEALAYATATPQLLAEAEAAGASPLRASTPRTIRSGRLRLEVLWPPRQLVRASGRGGRPDAEQVNRLSIVALAHLGGFSILLTGDAEAESVPFQPGPIDVLKVAHHGSEDAGLDGLLDRALPRLAVISVGDPNPYGHPSLATLAELAEHGVPVMRTDLDGQVEIEVRGGRWTVDAGAG